MGSSWGMFIFDTVVNMYQGAVAVLFLMLILGCKGKYGWKSTMICGVFSVFLLLEVETFMTSYEGYGIVILFLVIFVFAYIFLDGRNLVKILYCGTFIVISLIASGIVGGIAASLNNKNYIEYVSQDTAHKCIGMIMNQIVLFFMCGAVVWITKRNKLGINKKATVICASIPILGVMSIVSVEIILDNPSSKISIINLCIALSGITLIVALSFALYIVEEYHYSAKLQNEMENKIYEQQLTDVAAIKEYYYQAEKRQHEVNKIFDTLGQMLLDNRTQEAVGFLDKFDKSSIINAPKIIYTDNVILNYLLNRKREAASEKGIDLKYIVSGIIDGIDDVDLHVLICNIIDNAFEATEKLDKAYVSISIYGDENSICIESLNSIGNYVMGNNPTFETTKKDKQKHGYGMKNIKSVVEKYHGKLLCEDKDGGFFSEKCVILKNSGQNRAFQDGCIEVEK